MTSLRLANIVHLGQEVLALEHRDILVSVPEIEHSFGLESSPAQFADATSFRRRVFSLGLSGLSDVLEVLADGEPPANAVLSSAECMYLAPTTVDPALFEFAASDHGPPVFHRGFGRCLLGHDAPLPIPVDEPDAEVSAQIAAVLAEDVRDATPEQARRAILGYSILSMWVLPMRDRLSSGWGHYRLGQLGPCLVVPNESFDPAQCDVCIRVNGEKTASGSAGRLRMRFDEMIAFASDGVELHAGDVIASGPVCCVKSGPRRPLRERDRVSAEIVGLGVLSGMVVTGHASQDVQRWTQRC